MMVTKALWTRLSAGLLAAAATVMLAVGLQAAEPFIQADVPLFSNRDQALLPVAESAGHQPRHRVGCQSEAVRRER